MQSDQDEMKNLYRGSTIDASYQASGHLAKPFQKQELPVAIMFDSGSKLNEQYLQRIFHSCFIPIFGSFGQVVSEEKVI